MNTLLIDNDNYLFLALFLFV